MNDIAIVPQINLNQGAPIIPKISYLITLVDTMSKQKSIQRFISIDNIDFLNGFIRTKGIFVDYDEDHIKKNYAEVLTTANKDLYSDMMFPAHRVLSIRSLVYKQSTNIVKK